MAIQDINTLVDNNITELTNKFNYYALANLGQRFGLAGDSVTTGNFKFVDLLNKKLADIENGSIGQIKYYNNKVVIGSLKDGISSNMKQIKNTTPYIITEDNIYISNNYSINGSDYYATGSIIGYDEKYDAYYYSAIGISNGSTEIYNEYTLFVIDAVTNELKCGYKVINCTYDENNNLIIDVNNTNILKPTIFKLLKISDKTYSLNIYNIDNVSFEDLIKDIVNNVKDNINVSSDVDILYNCYDFRSFNDIYNCDVDIDNEKNQLFSVSDNDVINHYLTHLSNELSIASPEFIKYYSENKFNKTNITLLEQIFINVINKIVTDSKLKDTLISNYSYINIFIPLDYSFNYFCKDSKDNYNIYGSSQNIYVNFVNTDLNDINDISLITLNTKDNTRVSLYSFNCEYKNELLNKINVSIDYTLPYINTDNYWVVNNNVTNVLAKGQDAGQPNIIIIYNEYDESTQGPKPKVLRSSNYKDIFSLIDAENYNSKYWVEKTFNYLLNSKEIKPTEDNKDESIEDSDIIEDNIEDETEVSSEYNNLVKMINELNDKINKYHNSTLTPEDTNDTTEDNNSNNNNQYIAEYSFKTMLPAYKKLGDYRKELLKNSIIINITDARNINSKNELNEILNDNIYEHFNITTFWVIGEDEFGESDFICIKNPEYENFALDINYMCMIDSYVNYLLSQSEQLEPDNYTFTHLIFDNINETVKNNIINDSQQNALKIYPNIRNINDNINSGDDNDNKYYKGSFESNNYLNKANLLIEFSTGLKTSINANNKKIIENINNNDNKFGYLNSDNQFIPNSYYSNNENHVIKSAYSYAYTFNSTVPTIDAKEVVVRNENVLNRLNIVTLDNNNHLYYSYIGANYNKQDKSILQVGTGNINESWGNKTLSKNNDNFKTHDGISFNFNNIYNNYGDVITTNYIVSLSKPNLVEYKANSSNIYINEISNSSYITYNGSYIALLSESDIVNQYLPILNDNYTISTNLDKVNNKYLIYMNGKVKQLSILYNINSNILEITDNSNYWKPLINLK